jgi:hypothetical protein
VYNFGRCYYQSTQERILFEQLLLNGHIPHVAIFIDGINDFFLPEGLPATDQTFESMMAGQTKSAPTVTLLTNLAIIKVVNRVTDARRKPSTQFSDSLKVFQSKVHLLTPVAHIVCERYLRNKQSIENLAAGHGVQTYFVWQPTPTYRYDVTHHPFSAGLGLHWFSKFGYEHMASLLQTNAQPANFLWCADIQEGLREPLYIDAIHYSAPMCDRVGRTIAEMVLVLDRKRIH